MKTKQIIAKYEGHLYPVQHLSFAPATYTFMSAANSECMLWNPKEQLKGGDHVAEISQPDKILDLASSDLITSVVLKEIGDDKTYMIAVQTDNTSSVFYTKSIGISSKASASKSKTVKKESSIRLAAASEEFIHASLINETSLSYVHGSVYGIKRSHIKLLDDSGKVQKEIVL